MDTESGTVKPEAAASLSRTPHTHPGRESEGDGPTPLVSVVIPTHNRAKLVRRAISSVLGQTYDDFELIVVDDASSDDTEKAVASLGDERIRYIRHETNRHASASRNTGIAHSRGKYIAFLDDDDEWLPRKLSEQVDLIESLPHSVGMIYCWMDVYRDGKLEHRRRPELRGAIFGHVLDSQRIGNSSTLVVRRQLIDQVGGFDESIPRGNDGDFIRRVCLEYQVDFVPITLVVMHMGHGFVQISDLDTQGHCNAIHGHEVKLVKFKDQMPLYPRQAAAIYSSIAYHYARLGLWKSSSQYYLKAIRTTPFSALPYVKIARTLIGKLKG